MKVRMLKAVNGTVDGVRMGPFFLGHEYDLDNDLAERFVQSALAEEALPGGDPAPLEVGEPAVLVAPEPPQPAEPADEFHDLN
jgi:hypothetical protein